MYTANILLLSVFYHMKAVYFIQYPNDTKHDNIANDYSH